MYAKTIGHGNESARTENTPLQANRSTYHLLNTPKTKKPQSVDRGFRYLVYVLKNSATAYHHGNGFIQS